MKNIFAILITTFLSSFAFSSPAQYFIGNLRPAQHTGGGSGFLLETPSGRSVIKLVKTDRLINDERLQELVGEQVWVYGVESLCGAQSVEGETGTYKCILTEDFGRVQNLENE